MLTQNHTMLTDLYQITMMNGYLQEAIASRQACFELFFRRTPFQGGYCVAAGLASALDFIEHLRFESEDIDYLRAQNLFSPKFLEWLRTFRFTGTIHAIPEGTVVFPNEPLLRVTGPLLEVQLLETFLLNTLNFQTLIATKSARIWEASGRADILEFGLRRAHGPDGALSASRAAFIGGCSGSSNVMAGKNLGIPIKGTMAHSWVMSFSDELTAFRAYADSYPDSSVLLVDTFDTLREGLPHAITVGKELAAKGHALKGIRLDSGDLAFLSIEARKMLDAAGLSQVKIVASNDLDEWIIETLRHQNARIDIWGVGTKLITAAPESALGGVFKLVALENQQGQMEPKIKISQNIEKTTIPGAKNLFRVYDPAGMMVSDVLALADETFPGNAPARIHHPQVDYKVARIDHFPQIEQLLQEVYSSGKRIGPSPTLPDIQARMKKQLDSLHPTHRRLANPHTYKVGLTQKLFELRQELIRRSLGETTEIPASAR